MRIGLVTGEYPPLRGGVGDYSAMLAGRWAALGHEVHVLARPASHDTRQGIMMHNVMPDWGLPAPFFVRHWAHHQQLDVISLQYQTAIYDMSAWMHAVPFLSPVAVVTTFHDLLVPYLFPKAGRVRGWIVRELARTSQAVITTNAEDHDRLRPLPHRHLIPIGSNIEVSAISDDERLRLRATVAAPDEILLAHFGFLYPNRGVDELLHALKQLLKQGTRARLVMIGGRSGGPTDTAYVAHLDALIHESGLDEHVTWTGFLEAPQVSHWLQSVDWVVLPFRDGASYRRGSLIAAIMHGCAIVTTQPAVALETMRDGETMALVPSGDVAALTQKINTLTHDPKIRERCRAGVLSVRDQFNWDTIARHTISVFEGMPQGAR